MADQPKAITVKVEADIDLPAIKRLVWDYVFQYSEWLDADQQLVIGDDVSGDKRTHEDLVEEYFNYRSAQ